MNQTAYGASKSSKREVHAHEMVANLAKELTMADYEVLMGDNMVRARWKARHPGASELGLQAAWMKRYWSAHIEPARATLAGMLSLPYDDELKSRIHDALIKDATLKRGRKSHLALATTGVVANGS